MKPSYLDLRRIPVLSALSELQCQEMMERSQTVLLDRGQYLFHRDDPASHFFFLNSGKVKILRNNDKGGEKIISIVHKKEIFAEAAVFLEHAKYPASACALEDAEITKMPTELLLKYLTESPSVALGLIGELSAKLHAQVVEIDNLSLQNATFRLLYFINSLMLVGADDQASVVLPAPKHAIASRLSITPETLSRSLQQLSRDGIVVSVGKSREMFIPSVSKMREYLVSSKE